MIFTRWGVYKAEADSTRQHAHILNSMLDEYHNIVGEEEVGGERDEDSTAVGGRNAATAGVSNAPLCEDIRPGGHRVVRGDGACI